ncbi:MAG: hypothetical protein QM811_06920 [Pirellulales bacterium]
MTLAEFKAAAKQFLADNAQLVYAELYAKLKAFLVAQAFGLSDADGAAKKAAVLSVVNGFIDAQFTGLWAFLAPIAKFLAGYAVEQLYLQLKPVGA